MPLIKNKLSAVEMSAESQIERVGRPYGMMGAEQMITCRLDWLAAGGIDGAIRSEEPWCVLQPVPAACPHRGTKLIDADPSVMVSSYGAELSDTRHFSNQRLQRLKAACGIHQISAQQDKVGTFRQRDLQ